MAIESIRRSQVRRLQVEPLEARWMMSGDSLFTQSLYGAIDGSAASSTNFGLIGVFGATPNSFTPLLAEHEVNSAGYSGLAFGPLGDLYAATATPVASVLRRIDPLAASVFTETVILAGTEGVTVDDLTHSGSGPLLLAVGRTVSDPAEETWLFAIDPTTGSAERRGRVDLRGVVSLATGPEGRLYATGEGVGGLELRQLDPATTNTLSTIPLVTTTLPGRLGAFRGLATSSAGVIVGVDGETTTLYRVDTATGAVTSLPIGGPDRGALGDLAFRPGASDEPQSLFHTDFEGDAGGFTIDNSGAPPGMWHRSVGRRDDGHVSHTPLHSFYYGQFESSIGGGRYDLALPRRHRGSIDSPQVGIPADGTTILSFNYVLDVRPELDRDFVEVQVVDGSQVTTLLSRLEGTLPQTIRGRWRTATVDLTEFAGRTVSIRFSFDTGDPPTFDPEGWYIDDVSIVNLGDGTPPPVGSLRGIKYHDRDGDGVRETGEEGLSGAQFTLTGPGGFSQSGASGVDGAYAFFNLAPGNYTLTETTPPAGAVPIPPISLTIGSGQSLTLDVANRLFGSLSGIKYHDRDGDGARESGEEGLPGAQFTLTGPGGFSQTTTSVADGAYAFSNLVPGDYTLTETTPPAGALPIPPISLTIGSGEMLTRDVANPLVGSLVGVKYHDRDGDGVRETGEEGLPGAQFTLTGPDGFSQNVTTGVGGAFSFANLAPGDYTLTEMAPPTGFVLIATPIPVTIGSGEVLTRDVANQADPEPPTVERVQFGTPLEVYRKDSMWKPLVRPADDHFGYIDPTSRTDGAGTLEEPPSMNEEERFAFSKSLFDALKPLQSRTISAPAVGSSLSVDWRIDLSEIAPAANSTRRDELARQFVTVYFRQGVGGPYTRVTGEHGILAGQDLELFFFYDPTERDLSGEVINQYPSWVAEEPGFGVRHQFRPTDHLLVTTGGRETRFNLEGGSTFDSDINYDGVVDSDDRTLLDRILRGDLRISQRQPGFDPTLDTNARFPNGTEGVFGSSWPILGPPSRELNTGDDITFNIEEVRVPASVGSFSLVEPATLALETGSQESRLVAPVTPPEFDLASLVAMPSSPAVTQPLPAPAKPVSPQARSFSGVVAGVEPARATSGFLTHADPPPRRAVDPGDRIEQTAFRSRALANLLNLTTPVAIPYHPELDRNGSSTSFAAKDEALATLSVTDPARDWSAF